MPKRLLILVCVTLLSVPAASAQTTTYRWTDKTTGQVVYSDKPPPPGATQVVKISSDGRAGDQQLPYATRQAADKFPVTLYTTASCVSECKTARDLLNGRGIPFTEKMLNTQEEISALTKRLGSEAGIPSISVGQQNFNGFESGAWNNLLDLAGYPKSAAYGAKPSGTLGQ